MVAASFYNCVILITEGKKQYKIKKPRKRGGFCGEKLILGISHAELEPTPSTPLPEYMEMKPISEHQRRIPPQKSCFS